MFGRKGGGGLSSCYASNSCAMLNKKKTRFEVTKVNVKIRVGKENQMRNQLNELFRDSLFVFFSSGLLKYI